MPYKQPNLQTLSILDKLPDSPGVYLFKDANGVILYIGKAISLKNRVRSYFAPRHTDWKIAALMAEQASIDYIITAHEHDASVLEAKLIQEHRPKYNVLLRDGQPFLYLLFTKEPDPRLKIVRIRKEKGIYIGPFIKKQYVRATHRYLLEVFKLNRCNKNIAHGCLDYHLGTCPGSCMPNFDEQGYRTRLSLAHNALTRNREAFMQTIQAQVTEYSKTLAFEKAQQLQNYLETIDTIFATLEHHTKLDQLEPEIFIATSPDPYNQKSNGVQNFQQIETLQAALQVLLGIKTPIHSIDCFDISHFQSNSIVGACVRFTNGRPDPRGFRRFQIRTIQEQDDYAALREIVKRRYKKHQDYPQAILIDGGKGQLNTVLPLIPEGVLCLSLAKREERLFGQISPELLEGIVLDHHDPAAQMLMALRDYTHHFAISYHRFRRSKNI